MSSSQQKPMRADTSPTKRSDPTGIATAMSTCEVRIEVPEGMNCSSLARAVVSYAERLHRKMGYRVSVERYTIGGVTVLRVWNGDVGNSYAPAIGTVPEDL